MKDNIIARIVGLTAFILGIGLLLTVFFMVYTVFIGDSNSIIAAIKDTKSPIADNMLRWSINIGIKILMLVFMIVSGAIIADRGIKFYFGEDIRSKE